MVGSFSVKEVPACNSFTIKWDNGDEVHKSVAPGIDIGLVKKMESKWGRSKNDKIDSKQTVFNVYNVFNYKFVWLLLVFDNVYVHMSY